MDELHPIYDSQRFDREEKGVEALEAIPFIYALIN